MLTLSSDESGSCSRPNTETELAKKKVKPDLCGSMQGIFSRIYKLSTLQKVACKRMEEKDFVHDFLALTVVKLGRLTA
jgi:hypothetical protein